MEQSKKISITEKAPQSKKIPPKIICPYCRQVILIDIKAFSEDMSTFLKSQCPNCKNYIFVCLIILANTELDALIHDLQRVIKTVEPDNSFFIEKESKNEIWKMDKSWIHRTRWKEYYCKTLFSTRRRTLELV